MSKEEEKIKLTKQGEKRKYWVLYIECKFYLEGNEKNWKMRKRECETEHKRQERLQIHMQREMEQNMINSKRKKTKKEIP